MAETHTELLVIGAGQAGLAMGYRLQQAGRDFMIVDAGREVGHTWRDRWQSLKLFSPRSYSALPGLPFPGPSKGYPTKDQVADYLQEYASHFKLPIRLRTRITRLTRSRAGFRAVAGQSIITARQVVVATGPYHQARYPKLPGQLGLSVWQIHSIDYREPSQVPDGNVLIIGAGNSGAEIASELAASRHVTISANQEPRYLPDALFGKTIYWWLEKMGIMTAQRGSGSGEWLKRRGEPIVGNKLDRLIKSGQVMLRPGVSRLEGTEVEFADGQRQGVTNVVWATGYTADYSWIDIPSVVDGEGQPLENHGVSPVGGLYFLGLPWQRSLSSSILYGVGRDAEFLVSNIVASADRVGLR